jgi:hypothetical protein
MYLITVKPVLTTTSEQSKIMNQRDPRVSVTPAVEEIINVKVYNNDCRKK